MIQCDHHDFQRYPGCFDSQQPDIVRSQVRYTFCFAGRRSELVPTVFREPHTSTDIPQQTYICRSIPQQLLPATD